MASNASRAPLLRGIIGRGFAAQAKIRPIGDASSVSVNVLDNKLVVATAESALPTTRISAAFRAGSRYETYDIQGASHITRIAAGLTTQNSSGFIISRNIAQVGGTLSVYGDREIIAYTVETSAENAETTLRYLRDIIQPAFKPWEVERSLPQVKAQIEAVSKQEWAVELLHRAAFRNGLGNSIYIPSHKLGKISSESLLHFVNNTFTPSRAAIVGVGIDNNTLTGFAHTLELASGAGAKSESATYYGGDARVDTHGYTASVAVAGQGANLLNHKELLAFAILQQALGSGACTKRGAGSSEFAKAAASAVGDAGTATVKAVNLSYTDAGLFGFVASADAKDIGKVVDSLVRALKSGAVAEKDIVKGKALLKARILERYTSDRGLLKQAIRQSVLSRTVIDADTLIPAIDGISVQQVQEAARKAGCSKLSVGAIGNLANVPYASDLA